MGAVNYILVITSMFQKHPPRCLLKDLIIKSLITPSQVSVMQDEIYEKKQLVWQKICITLLIYKL